MTLIDTAIERSAREILLRRWLDARLGTPRRCGFCRLGYRNRIGVEHAGTWYCDGACARARRRGKRLSGDDLLAWIFGRPRREPEVKIPSPAEQAENARRYRRARETQRLLAAWDRGEVSAADLA